LNILDNLMRAMYNFTLIIVLFQRWIEWPLVIPMTKRLTTQDCDFFVF